jgi:RNA polymerase sigma factor (sigma-70 family)
LVEQLEERVKLVLLRSVGRECEPELDDLAQEVWTRLLLHERAALRTLRLDHEGSLGAFAGKVALRVAIDHGRKRRVRPQGGEGLASLELVAHDAPPLDEQLSAEREKRALSAALAQVVEGERAHRDLFVLRAHFEDGQNPAEIAQTGCGLSAKGVESLLRRARERLAAMLAPKAGGAP